MKDLCEQDFSSMLYVKNKYTSQMKDLDNRLRLKLTNIEPDCGRHCVCLLTAISLYYCIEFLLFSPLQAPYFQ